MGVATICFHSTKRPICDAFLHNVGAFALVASCPIARRSAHDETVSTDFLAAMNLGRPLFSAAGRGVAHCVSRGPIGLSDQGQVEASRQDPAILTDPAMGLGVLPLREPAGRGPTAR
jgi:hypothetical protein